MTGFGDCGPGAGAAVASSVPGGVVTTGESGAAGPETTYAGALAAGAAVLTAADGLADAPLAFTRTVSARGNMRMT